MTITTIRQGLTDEARTEVRRVAGEELKAALQIAKDTANEHLKATMRALEVVVREGPGAGKSGLALLERMGDALQRMEQRQRRVLRAKLAAVTLLGLAVLAVGVALYLRPDLVAHLQAYVR